MPRTPLVKEVGWRLGALGFDIAHALVRALPVDAASALGGALSRTLGPLTKAHRTAELGLILAFPEMDAPQRNRIARQQWDSFGRYIFEFPHVDRISPASGRVEVVDAWRLADIAASQRAAVFVSGHFANPDLMAAVILAAGIRCNVTYRAANNPYVAARMVESRRRYGVKLFAPKGGEGAREMLEGFTHNVSAAMMNDQRYDAGVAAPFFGRAVMTNPAAVRFALRFDIPIVPLSMERLKGARYRCRVHPPIEVPRSGERAADIAAGVAAINAFIEARVRERPGEWWWLHRRWRASDYAEAAAALRG
jgi:KDO2-lipid IV(A) lauroyltransferase